MDKSNVTTDAFVEVKLGTSCFKTDVKRKSLNPIFNSIWFRFEIDDLDLYASFKDNSEFKLN